MKSLLFLATILSAHAVLAASLTQDLTEKFKTRISVLDRDMITFRYETKDRKGLQTVDDVVGRITGWGDRFFDESLVSYDVAGPGNYVAIDPYASRSFGQKEPKLYVLTIKKGTRLLNLNKFFAEDETKLIKEIHNKLQCKAKRGADETLIPENEMSFFSLRQSSTLPCRQAAIEIAKDLKVQGIVYGYTASTSLAECRRSTVAINMTSSDAIEYDKTLYFSNEAAIEGTKFGGFVRKLYEEAAGDFSMMLSQNGDYQIPKSLAGRSLPSDKAYSQWKQTYIYNCGAKWSPEEKQSEKLVFAQQQFDKYYKDKELETLLLSFKKAYMAKGQGKAFYFYLGDFKKFLKLTFEVSGLGQDEKTFERWRTLRNTYYSNTADRDELKKMFNTPKLQDEVYLQMAKESEKYVEQASKSELDSPDLYYRILTRLNLSSSYALVFQNEMHLYMGRALMISRDPKKSFAENLVISKQIYKKALKECIQVYSDPNITFDDAQKTECGK